jgi:hypothetical protein
MLGYDPYEVETIDEARAVISKLRAEKTAECDCCGYVNGSGKLSEYRKLLQIAALQAQDNG